jgi:hypothetical protein
MWLHFYGAQLPALHVDAAVYALQAAAEQGVD